MHRVLGPEVDVPAPDVNTNGQIMDWMVDEYKKITNEPKSFAVFTGKPIEHGGSWGRAEATGYGGVYVFEGLIQKKLVSLPAGASIAIQGFGNVATYFAEAARSLGFIVVAVSDSKGGIYKPEGLDIAQVGEYKKQTGSVTGFAGARTITNAELLELPVDVLVPAALENVLNKENAERIQAKLIIEMANGPTTPEADVVLNAKNISIIPDILANSGGVATSYFEWYQNIHNETWGKEDVLKRLKELITKALADVADVIQEFNITYRNAAYIVAARRILEKMEN
jgi:glutamate dehydrogenase (NAD(P)+)